MSEDEIKNERITEIINLIGEKRHDIANSLAIIMSSSEKNMMILSKEPNDINVEAVLKDFEKIFARSKKIIDELDDLKEKTMLKVA